MLLRFPEPYDFALSTERFRAFGIDLANLWHEGGLHRVIGGREVRIEAAPGGVDVGPLGGVVNVEPLGGVVDVEPLDGVVNVEPLDGVVNVEPLDDETESVVLQLLGAPFDLPAFYAWAAGQPVLGELVPKLLGLRPPLAPDPFESIVTSITAQQVSLFSAFAIRNRLIERFGVRAEHAYAFPLRERLAEASEAEIVAVGFSRRKAEYVVGLARSDLDLDGLAALDDDEVRSRITALRGLGPWTAEWFLARHLARPRAWPIGDLALRKAAELLYGVDVISLGPRLEPFQNLSAHYLLTGSRVVGAA